MRRVLPAGWRPGTPGASRATLPAVPGDRRRLEGFTLVEIIVVMAIVVMLFGLVAVSLRQYIGRASEKATEALIRRLQQHLDTYKSLTGEYPPDGIDTPQKNEKGERIVGSACLYYYLSRPVWQREMVAGKETRREHPPIASELTDSELSDPDPDYPGVREILDGWRVPIHYDNTSNGRFKPQRGEVHYPPIDDEQHPPDPRDGPEEIEGEKAAPKHGIQGKGFDLWSHGYREHDMDATPTKPIASWNT